VRRYYIGRVKLYWKQWGLATVAVAGLLAGGCGGFGASQSISPATFLLPGLGQTKPGTARPALAGPSQQAQPLVAASH